jgi:hypothetical protein
MASHPLSLCLGPGPEKVHDRIEILFEALLVVSIAGGSGTIASVLAVITTAA